MKLLITGAAGFIGSHFTKYWLENYPGDLVVGLDLLTYAGSLKNLGEAERDPHFQFVQGDISDRIRMDKLFCQERFDLVVNFAAESHVDRSISHPDQFMRANILGPQVLLETCRKYGVGRYHQISTDEVYGSLPLERPDSFFTEESPLCAYSPYSASKASADLMVLAYYHTYQLPVTISRCSNNYGTNQYPEKLIPRMVFCALRGEPLPVYGTGENIRDWISVTDHCEAVARILLAGRPGEVYNIGAHDEKTNLWVVKEILRELGRPESLISFVADRPGHDLRYAIDSGKSYRELGWKAKHRMEEELPKVVEWYCRNQDWWEKKQ